MFVRNLQDQSIKEGYVVVAVTMQEHMDHLGVDEIDNFTGLGEFATKDEFQRRKKCWCLEKLDQGLNVIEHLIAKRGKTAAAKLR